MTQALRKLQNNWLGVLIPILVVLHSSGTTIADSDHCLASVPTSLGEAIKQDHPGWSIVTLDMLGAYKNMFLKQGKGGCPGVVKVDFYGDGTDVFAIVLIKITPFDRYNTIDRKARLIIGRRIGDKRWRLATLEENINVVWDPPVVLVKPPGFKLRTLRSKHEAILVVGYDYWASMYVWTGKSIEKEYEEVD